MDRHPRPLLTYPHAVLLTWLALLEMILAVCLYSGPEVSSSENSCSHVACT